MAIVSVLVLVLGTSYAVSPIEQAKIFANENFNNNKEFFRQALISCDYIHAQNNNKIW